MADFAEALEKLTDVLAPSGLMLPFAGKSIPDGWLLCNGAAVSRTTYANLFAAIGTAWGTGDGSTTFNLPNCDSRFMEGTTDASKVGTYLEAGLPNITGTIAAGVGTRGFLPWALSTGAFASLSGAGTDYLYKEGVWKGNYASQLDASMSAAIYGSATTVRPKSAQTLIIIKV